MILLVPTVETVHGVDVKEYPAVSSGVRFNGTFRTFMGSERNVNGVYSVADTGTIETWYRPDIKADCRIVLPDGEVYEVYGTPEDIDRRHQFLVFRVQRIAGGA